MDPRHLFVDERLTGRCVYCGAVPSTRDHCPSKVLLDEPYPPDLPVVEACEECNSSYSKDEQYLGCLIECVICGSAEPDRVSREKIKRILDENPALAGLLRRSQTKDDTGNTIWEADVTRVRRVLLKLARGHLAYELSLPNLDEPGHVAFKPLLMMSDDQRSEFESPRNHMALWPEIGSRAFIRAVKTFAGAPSCEWIVVQPGRYRYMVSQSDGDFVHIVLSEYLACRSVWY